MRTGLFRGAGTGRSLTRTCDFPGRCFPDNAVACGLTDTGRAADILTGATGDQLPGTIGGTDGIALETFGKSGLRTKGTALGAATYAASVTIVIIVGIEAVVDILIIIGIEVHPGIKPTVIS